jgi:uncharacterized protein (DUF2062 family)
VRYPESTNVRGFFTRLWRRTCNLWMRAKREHSTPGELAWSVAIGVFCGCSPFIGLHMWMALALASALRLNRLWAVLGTRVSTSVLLAWIAFSEIELAHRLRTGAWLALSLDQVTTRALDHGWQLFGDWLLGWVMVGAILAILLGVLALGAARRWQRIRLRTPEALLPPTSESPASAPPAPTS